MRAYRFIVFYCVLFWLSFTLGAVEHNKYPVRGTVLIQDGKATKISLLVQSDIENIRVPVDIDGNFSTYLKWNVDYKIQFSKIGYVSKIIDFSTKIPASVNKSNIYPYEILVELFPKFPNVDSIFYKKAVAKIHYSNIINDFDYDLDYHLIVQRKIEKTKKAYQEWLKENARAAMAQAISDENEKAEAIIRYQKKMENRTVDNSVSENESITRKFKPKEKDNPFGLPSLKTNYPNGKTLEIFKLKNKQITRVVISKSDNSKIFYSVKHDWGGNFYFVQESPIIYRSISKYNFDTSTKD